MHWNIRRSKHFFWLYLIICESQAALITKLSELLFRDCCAVGGVQIHQLFVTGDDFLDLLQVLCDFRGLGPDRGSCFSPLFPDLTQAPL